MRTYRAVISSALSVYYRTLLNTDADITWNLLSVNVLRYLPYPYTNGPEQRLSQLQYSGDEYRALLY